MITGLHHVAVSVNDFDAGVRDYETLLGRKAAWVGGEGPTAQAWFDLPNMSLALIAPKSTGPLSVRLREPMEPKEGISRLAFAVANVEKAHRLLTQRAVEIEAPTSDQFGPSHSASAWLSTTSTYGVRLGLVESDLTAPKAQGDGLDHIVVGTPDPERAIVLYGARLGLDLRLDRSNPAWDARLLFFRCGDLIVEIAHRLSIGKSDGPDSFMGFSWRASDLKGAHARLSEAKFNVSEIRKGRRPGSSVFSVRDRTGGVPTIFVGPEQPAG